MNSPTREAQAPEITFEQFDALREMSFWLAPDTNANGKKLDVYLPHVEIGDSLRGEEPAIRDIEAHYVRQGTAEAFVITVAERGISDSGTLTRYEMIGKSNTRTIIKAALHQRIHTSNGSTYEVRRPLEGRDMPRLVRSLIYFDEVSDRSSKLATVS
jgi:hypothetical protein